MGQFQVSHDAARVRLMKLGFLAEAEVALGTLFRL